MYSPERGGTYRERPNTSKIYYRSGMSTIAREKVAEALEVVMPIAESISDLSRLEGNIEDFKEKLPKKPKK